MYNTLSDYLHDYPKYFRFSREEVVGWLVTSFFAAFIFTFNDWGVEEFDPVMGVTSLASMAVFLFIVWAVTTSLLKLFALRFGYQMYYQPHLLGLMAGLVIAVASAGYLPIFVPGGFQYGKPERQYVGHWRGFHRAWEVAMISGAFPMLLLLWAFVANRAYLVTGSDRVLGFVAALCLSAVYCMIPLPNVALQYGGRVLDFFRYLKGMTFGLDVYMNSRVWYVMLSVFVLLTSFLTWFLTVEEVRMGFWIWFVTMLVGALVLWGYKEFWEDVGPYYRH